MLTYPDRQKFAQIRAQWELAQPLSSSPLTMAGRKERAIGHVPSTTDAANAGPSKFRRKLSYGLSFISNPRTQRKTTPGRPVPGAGDVSLHNNSIEKANTVERFGEPNNTLSPIPSPTKVTSAPSQLSATQSLNLNSEAEIGRCNNLTTTPNPLPRSLTMSFIPRPIKDECDSPAIQTASSSTAHPPPFSLSAPCPPARPPPTKIPNPSPPQDDTLRRNSPRQYIRQNSTQQEKHIATGVALAGTSPSPSKASVRSYTAPNLHKIYRPPQSSLMAPRKSTIKRKPTVSPTGKHRMLA
jgi:hypothetical protein